MQGQSLGLTEFWGFDFVAFEAWHPLPGEVPGQWGARKGTSLETLYRHSGLESWPNSQSPVINGN